MDLAIRLDLQHTEENDNKIQQFINLFTPIAFLYVREISEKEKKQHYHLYIRTPDTLTKTVGSYKKDLNKLIRKEIDEELKKNKLAVQLVENLEGYLGYCYKDKDIVNEQFPEDYELDVEAIYNKSMEVNEDKHKAAYQKVYEALKDKSIKNTHDYVKHITLLYINDWNRPPPARHIIINSLHYYLAQIGDYQSMTDLLNIPMVYFNRDETQKIYEDDENTQFKTTIISTKNKNI